MPADRPGWSAEELAARVAADMAEGWIVNIGIGQPQTIIPLLAGRRILLHSENGILGLGPAPEGEPADPDIINAGKSPASLLPGGSFMDSETSFAIMRGGRLDLGVMGAYEVSTAGDLANWKLSGSRFGGIGGALDVAAGARRVWVMAALWAKDGSVKLVRHCHHPLTAAGVVDRVYTDYGIFEPQGDRFALVEAPTGVDEAWLAGAGVPLAAG